jgi:hypothetical protein
MKARTFILFTLSCLPFFTYAQWPLPVLGVQSYQYSTDQYLLSKVKYTSRGGSAALFNWIEFPVSDNITIDGDQSNYKLGLNQGIFILRNEPSNYIGGNGHEFIRILGSVSDYGVDFETYENDDLLILGNIVGNNWDLVSPSAGNKDDSTQLLLCKYSVQLKSVVWTKIYGGSSAEYAVSIKKTKDGNFMILAQTQSGDGDEKGYRGGKDIWLLKINVLGNIIWQKTFGSDKDEIATDLEVLDDGSMLISGSADQSTFASSPYSGKNSFLLKLDAAGNKIWIKVFGGNGDDKIKAISALDDGFVSLGISTSSDGDYPVNLGKNDVYIFKHDLSGAILWKKH